MSAFGVNIVLWFRSVNYVRLYKIIGNEESMKNDSFVLHTLVFGRMTSRDTRSLYIRLQPFSIGEWCLSWQKTIFTALQCHRSHFQEALRKQKKKNSLLLHQTSKSPLCCIRERGKQTHQRKFLFIICRISRSQFQALLLFAICFHCDSLAATKLQSMAFI